MPAVGSVSETRFGVFFEWKIPKFFSLAEDSVEGFHSPVFSFSDCTWNLEFCPEGTDKWISLCLSQKSNNAVKTVTCTPGVKKANGKLEEDEPLNRTFKEGPLRIYILYLDDLHNLKSELASSDTLTITCRLENDLPHPVEVDPQAFKLVELETLSSNFNDLFASKKKCDVTVKVKDLDFQAHQAVLMARSPVFSAMFEHEMSEQETGVVTVPDCDPDSFGAFLHYLYTGKMEGVSYRNAYHLYVTSDKYQVQELKSFCLTYMTQSLTLDNVFDVVALAERYSEVGLMSSVQTFFNQNVNKIISTTEWETLVKENFPLANNLLKEMLANFKIQDQENRSQT